MHTQYVSVHIAQYLTQSMACRGLNFSFAAEVDKLSLLDRPDNAEDGEVQLFPHLSRPIAHSTIPDTPSARLSSPHSLEVFPVQCPSASPALADTLQGLKCASTPQWHPLTALRFPARYDLSTEHSIHDKSHSSAHRLGCI